MSVEENIAIVRRHCEEYWNQGKLEVADEIHSADYVFHQSNSPELRGSQAYDQFVSMYRSAFPDLHFSTEDLIAQGDKVVQRWSARGTHEGELIGIPATGSELPGSAYFAWRAL